MQYKTILLIDFKECRNSVISELYQQYALAYYLSENVIAILQFYWAL